MEIGANIMRKTIEVLNEASFKSVLSKPSEGLMAYTYLCLIEWPDGKQRQCYVKMFAVQQGIGVFNEILGYLLTKAEGLPVASKAGLLILPDAVRSLANKPVASVAFVTSRVEGNTPSSFYHINDMLKFESLNKILDGWDKLHQTIAFDEWVANQDRNLGNLVIDSHCSVTLIDHSNMPVDIVWQPTDLDCNLTPQNKLGSFFRNNPTLPQKHAILKGAEKQSDSFLAVKDEITFWANKLLREDYRLPLTNFLERRALTSHERLSREYGLLAGTGAA
ncbi:hypothetical protein [Enterobacter hormaechei]|uniref:hypothetical protein n=1 Tax=Enterobacter hormaechei TaxID=158836 RepID=UPI0032DB693F